MRPLTLSKKGPGVSLWILWNVYEHPFCRTPPVAINIFPILVVQKHHEELEKLHKDKEEVMNDAIFTFLEYRFYIILRPKE